MADSSINYCLKVEKEVEYCEFMNAVSAIFLLPVSAYALAGLLLSSFCNLLHRISHLSTAMAAFDVKQRSLTLFPVLPTPEVVFNGQTVADRTHILY